MVPRLYKKKLRFCLCILASVFDKKKIRASYFSQTNKQNCIIRRTLMVSICSVLFVPLQSPNDNKNLWQFTMWQHIACCDTKARLSSGGCLHAFSTPHK